MKLSKRLIVCLLNNYNQLKPFSQYLCVFRTQLEQGKSATPSNSSITALSHLYWTTYWRFEFCKRLASVIMNSYYTEGTLLLKVCNWTQSNHTLLLLGSWHKFCQHHHFDVPACWMLAYVVKPESLPLLLNCLRVEVSSRETQYCSSSVFELPLLDSKLIVVFATFTELFRQMWRRFRDGFQHRGWDQHSTGWEPSCVSPFNIWDNMECCQSVQVRNQSTP